MLAAGSYLHVTIGGEIKGILTFDDLRSAVGDELTQFPLETLNFSVSAAQSIVTDLVQGNWLHYNYVADLNVKADKDYADPHDLTLIVAHMFFAVTGIQPATASETVSASAPPPPVPATGPAEWWSGITSGVGSLASGVQSDVQLVVWGLIAILFTIVLVLAFSPQAGHLAAGLVA